MPAWREKYDEMKRWRERVANLTPDSDRARHNANLLDYLNAFFAACLHLRDWLNNDPSCPVPTGDASNAVNRPSSALSLCHAIAVGAKHLRIDDPKLDPKARVSVQSFSQTFGPLRFEASVAEVEATAEGQDAFKLADDCLREWDEFLRSKNLL